MSATQRVDDIFFKAIEIADEQARSIYLDSVCGSDQHLKSRVEKLLRNGQQIGSFLEKPFFSYSPFHDEDDSSPELGGESDLCFGPYRYLSKIGEGGMGEVYLAEQETPIRRTVAIKVIRGGMANASCLARFEQERQAISMMNHPNIARLLDAGTAAFFKPSAGGRDIPDTGGECPFFAMEFVCGSSLIQHCDDNRLTITQRIELLLQVCRAVHHAHQKGIIHRDLKPSNILMDTSEGQSIPKVIDFGIAKAIGLDTKSQVQTQVGQFIGTLEYMSPEQFDSQNHDVDTRTDIYALGVLLYQLVSGATPFSSQELQKDGLTGLLRILHDVEPEKPSVKVAKSSERQSIADHRHVDSQRLVSQVSGDLDSIILKCIEKDRERRYETANALANDLERFLANEPVQARPASLRYWFGKKLRKHYLSVAMLASFFCLVLATTIASIHQAIKASRAELKALEGWEQADVQRRSAENINDFLRDVIGNAKSDAKGANVRLVDTLSDASRVASQRFADDPIQEAKVHSLLGEVYADLTMLHESILELRRAVDLLRSVLNKDDRRVLATEVQLVRALMNAGNWRDAETILHGLLPRVQQAFDEHDPVVYDAERLTLSNLKSRARYSECIAGLRSLRDRALKAGLDDATLVPILSSLVTALRTQIGKGNREEEAKTVAEIERVAIDLWNRSSRWKGPESPQAIRARVIAAEMNVLRGNYQTAIEHCQQILKSSLDRLGEAHEQRIAAIGVLSEAKLRLGLKKEAAELQLQRLEYTRMGNPHPVSFTTKLGDALPYLDAGQCWEKGELLAREYAKALGETPGHDDFLLGAWAYVARFASCQGKIEEANEIFEALVSEVKERTGINHSIAKVHLFFALHQNEHGSPEQTEKHLKLAESALSDVRFGTNRANPDDLLLAFIAFYDRWNRGSEKAKYEALLRDVPYSLANAASIP